jgi:hypothetical protein
MKLGRLAPDYTKPRLWLEDYYQKIALPTPPMIVDRMSKVSEQPMYCNDRYGCCTIAGMGHLFGAQKAYANPPEVVFSDDQIISAYEANCPGFNPVTDANDNGCLMSDVLAYMTRTGMAGNTVTAYAQLRSTNIDSLKLALYLFGSVYIGVNLPQSAETQFGAGQAWTYVKGSPIIGGHCVVIQKTEPVYNPAHTVITWGSPVRVTDQWMQTYLEEAWVAITPDWIQTNQHTIDAIDLSALTADMSAI